MARELAARQGGRVRPRWLIGGALLAVVVLAALRYGPELVAYLRFGQALDAYARADELEGGPWPRPSDECTLCHGLGGNPVNQLYARLAGQPAAYVVAQLSAFASGARPSPTMAPLARTMSPAEIQGLARYFAGRRPERHSAFSADPIRVGLGEALARADNCVSCHGERLEGRDAVPRLAGQSHGYLVEQLAAFKSGARRDPVGGMNALAAGLSDDAIENLAQFLATR